MCRGAASAVHQQHALIHEITIHSPAQPLFNEYN